VIVKEKIEKEMEDMNLSLKRRRRNENRQDARSTNLLNFT
jgi:hypothetical protein